MVTSQEVIESKEGSVGSYTPPNSANSPNSPNSPNGPNGLSDPQDLNLDPLMIFRLSEIIARNYLKMDRKSAFIQEHGSNVLGRLITSYTDEGCNAYDNNDEPEKKFILRSLPLISSVIQLSTTIQHFNEAMEQVEKLYDLKEDKYFEQAIKLSYLVFVYVVYRGSQIYYGDEKWQEMLEQIARLVREELKLPCEKYAANYQFPSGRWYESAKKCAGELESLLNDNKKLEKEDKIEYLTKKIVERLENAFYLQPELQKDQNKFDSIIWYSLAQHYDKQIGYKRSESNNIRNDPSIGETERKNEKRRFDDEIQQMNAQAIMSLENAIQKQQREEQQRQDIEGKITQKEQYIQDQANQTDEEKNELKKLKDQLETLENVLRVFQAKKADCYYSLTKDYSQQTTNNSQCITNNTERIQEKNNQIAQKEQDKQDQVNQTDEEKNQLEKLKNDVDILNNQIAKLGNEVNKLPSQAIESLEKAIQFDDVKFKQMARKEAETGSAFDSIKNDERFRELIGN